MKTTKNLNQIAKVTFASVTFLFASLIPMQATSGKTGAEMNEIQAASERLAFYNLEIEKAVEFNAPDVSESFEIASAETRLEDIFGSIANAAEYTSPKVNENFEVAEAIQNLENLNSLLEQSVRFTASVN